MCMYIKMLAWMYSKALMVRLGVGISSDSSVLYSLIVLRILFIKFFSKAKKERKKTKKEKGHVRGVIKCKPHRIREQNRWRP